MTLATSVVGTALAAALTGLGTGASAAPRDESPVTADSRRALERVALPLGLQVERKHTSRPKQTVGTAFLNAPNPYLSLVPDPATVDYAYWAARGDRYSARRVRARAAAPSLYDEQEPAGQFGSNDRRVNAERITDLGLGAGQQSAVRIDGELAPPPRIVQKRIRTTENQGSIPLAKPTRIPGKRDRIVVTSRIGDGPHGHAGSGGGDFDFYKVRAEAGDTISAATFGNANFDTVLFLYDASGTVLASNDDVDFDLRSAFDYRVTEDAVYYVMVTGFLAVPEDPFRSGSGTGAGDEGRYNLRITAGPRDNDFYAVRLQAGDVLGGRVDGAARAIQVYRFDGQPRVGAAWDLSFIYPMSSPLPGGGNGSFAYVAEQPGLYAVAVGIGRGDYAATLEVFRPGTENGGQKVTQEIFLDFDGGRVNTGVFGGFGVSDLSPLSAFLGRWKLSGDQLDDVIDQVIATVQENVEADLAARGLNDDFRVLVRNSRDHADTFGQPNVSRVVVGGTIDESGVATIGIAQSIDPGNYEREETALVLLDVLSDPDRRDDASLNAYLRPRSDRVEFVGRAVGNVVSHEIGHMIGSFHVDQFNPVLNLMDQGGNFPLLYGVGEDGVGGTADDPDVDFGVDTYNPGEGFTGMEDTLNISAWASSGS